nr:hypothetical protein [Clostridia bacterium]
MVTLFENENIRLLSTGHDYDFVGVIETKTEKPMTFFFNSETDCEGEVYEDTTELVDVYEGLEPHDDEGWDEAEDIAQAMMMEYDYVNYMTTRDDKSTGFLSNPQERGWFLALVKNYCPEKIKEIPWA